MWEVKYDNKKHLSANYLMICRTMHHKSATHHVHNYSGVLKIQKDTNTDHLLIWWLTKKKPSGLISREPEKFWLSQIIKK